MSWYKNQNKTNIVIFFFEIPIFIYQSHIKMERLSSIFSTLFSAPTYHFFIVNWVEHQKLNQATP